MSTSTPPLRGQIRPRLTPSERAALRSREPSTSAVSPEAQRVSDYFRTREEALLASDDKAFWQGVLQTLESLGEPAWTAALPWCLKWSRSYEHLATNQNLVLFIVRVFGKQPTPDGELMRTLADLYGWLYPRRREQGGREPPLEAYLPPEDEASVEWESISEEEIGPIPQHTEIRKRVLYLCLEIISRVSLPVDVLLSSSSSLSPPTSTQPTRPFEVLRPFLSDLHLTPSSYDLSPSQAGQLTLDLMSHCTSAREAFLVYSALQTASPGAFASLQRGRLTRDIAAKLITLADGAGEVLCPEYLFRICEDMRPLPGDWTPDLILYHGSQSWVRWVRSFSGKRLVGASSREAGKQTILALARVKRFMEEEGRGKTWFWSVRTWNGLMGVGVRAGDFRSVREMWRGARKGPAVLTTNDETGEGGEEERVGGLARAPGVNAKTIALVSLDYFLLSRYNVSNGLSSPSRSQKFFDTCTLPSDLDYLQAEWPLLLADYPELLLSSPTLWSAYQLALARCGAWREAVDVVCEERPRRGVEIDVEGVAQLVDAMALAKRANGAGGGQGTTEVSEKELTQLREKLKKGVGEEVWSRAMKKQGVLRAMRKTKAGWSQRRTFSSPSL
jgi:hypothetical protein